jgi:outer membrane protein TolC
MAAVALSVPAMAQPVSETRLAELMAMAEARLTAGQASPGQSAPAVRLTLDEAVARAFEHNLDISAERLNPQIQNLSVALVRTAFSPSISSTVGQRAQTRLPTSQLNGGQRVVNDTTTYNGGFSQSIPWFGGSTSVSWNNSKLVTSDQFTLFNPQYTSTLTASYTQPLLRNLLIDSTRQQLATSQISRELSDVQLRAVVTTTLANVRNAYWDLVYANQAVDVARRSLALAEKLVEDNKLRVEIGALAKIDVVQAEAEAATRRQALALAEATQQTTELALKRLIVSGTGDPLWDSPLDPVDRPSFSAEVIDIKAAVRGALEKRTDLVQARRQLESSDITIRYLKNQRLPQLDLTASYSAQGLGGTRFERDRLGGAITAEYRGSSRTRWCTSRTWSTRRGTCR